MRWLNRFKFNSSQVEHDLQEEFEFHIAERARRLQDQGLSEPEALHQARQAFGDTDRYRAETMVVLTSRLLTRRTWLVASGCSAAACLVSIGLTLTIALRQQSRVVGELQANISQLNADLAPFRGIGELPLAQQVRFVTLRGNIVQPRVWTLPADSSVTLRDLVNKSGGLTAQATGDVVLTISNNGTESKQAFSRAKWINPSVPDIHLDGFCVVEVQ